MTVVLGVDGGGTGSHAIVADHEGVVLGFGKSGPSNWEDIGIEAAAAALKSAVREAFADSGLEPGEIDASVFGLAGVDFPSDEAKMGGIPQALGITSQFKIVNDSFVALRAGANHPWGVVIIAGSGSVVAGRNPAGETFRTLGLGPLFGDYGSSTDVSGEAITAVGSQLTGQGPRTSLTERMCEATRSASAIELIEGLARGRIQNNRFTPVVFEAAEAGDLVARRILEHAGSSLGDAAGHIARRLQMDDSEFELVLTGAMFRHESRLLVSALEVTVKRFARFAMPARLEAPPMVGATLLALEMASVPTDPELHATLALASNQVLEARSV
jgi:N-acetylglucosamine kinase-like BadF-type ATPase